jgi:hypothetical protein
VSLIPGANLDPRACAACSDGTRCNVCTNHHSSCDMGCSNKRTDHSEHCPPKFVNPAEYAKFEALLEQALAQVCARQNYAERQGDVRCSTAEEMPARACITRPARCVRG